MTELTVLLSMNGVIKTILIFAAFYFAFKLIARYVLPFVIKRYFERMQRDMHKRFQQQQTPPKKEGEINIDYIPPKNKKDIDDGEYIDYEEIK